MSPDFQIGKQATPFGFNTFINNAFTYVILSLFLFKFSDVDLYASFDSSSGPNVILTVTAAGTYVSGKKNSALRIEGSSQYFMFNDLRSRCAQSLHLCNNGITITFWLRFSGAPGNGNIMTSNIINIAYKYDNTCDLRLINPSISKQFIANYPVLLDQWVHYAITWDNPTNKMSLYFDGQLYATPPETAWGGVQTTFSVTGGVPFIYEFDEFYTFERLKDAQTVKLLSNY